MERTKLSFSATHANTNTVSMFRNEKMNSILQSWCSVCFTLFFALAFVGCSGSPKSPPGSGIVVDKDRKPMAGVHVIVWRDYTPAKSWWDFGNFVNLQSSPSRCHEEHYALSDAQGRFTFPGEVIDRPGQPFTSYIAVGAIKEGMMIKHFTANIEPTSTGLGMADGHQKDFFPKPEKPLEFVVEMQGVEYSKVSTTEELRDLAQYGCHCSPFRKAVYKEQIRYQDEWLRVREEKLLKGEPVGGAIFMPLDERCK
jgi:hypothetical protein